MKTKVISWFGWYGVVATVGAYLLVSFSVLSPTSLSYQLLNLTGALGVTIETWVRRDYQPFWLNLIWALIALVAIANLFIHIRI
jgi:hypothetical protein